MKAAVGLRPRLIMGLAKTEETTVIPKNLTNRSSRKPLPASTRRGPGRLKLLDVLVDARWALRELVAHVKA